MSGYKGKEPLKDWYAPDLVVSVLTQAEVRCHYCGKVLLSSQALTDAGDGEVSDHLFCNSSCLKEYELYLIDLDLREE